MPALRQRKRAASPDDTPQRDPPKKQPKRGKKAAASQPISISDDDEPPSPPPPKKAAKGRNRNAKADHDGDDDQANADDDVNVQSKSNGKGKAKAEAKVKDNAEADVGDAQYAKGGGVQNIPIDEGCSSALPRYSVYIDEDDGIIYDASLNQTNAGHNNNKFYRIQLVHNGRGDYKTWTRWGRVGEFGQSKVLGSGSLENALKEFDKKFKDKSGLRWDDRRDKPKSGKYVFVERSYEPDSESDSGDERATRAGGEKSRSRSVSPAKCTLDAPIKSLMELIFNQKFIADTMVELKYDAEKLPLGKLSKATITRGYEALKGLSELLDNPNLAASEHGTTYAAAVEQLSNQYYSYIPHAFGRNRPPVISTQNLLRNEVELLDSLTDLKAAETILKGGKSANVHPANAHYNSLGMREMTPVARTSAEFTNISEYLTKTKGDTHDVNYNVQEIFRIEREGETERFKAYSSSNSCRRLLWHGSVATNYGGILSQGLRIAPPEAPVNGYMFGKGVYLADMSSKSANYCRSMCSGGEALLLLCEAELGNPTHDLTDASSTAGHDALSKGMVSTWGKGTTGPNAWKDASCIHPSLEGVLMPDTATKPGRTNYPNAWLMYNEYICYTVDQIRLRYLLRVKV